MVKPSYSAAKDGRLIFVRKSISRDHTEIVRIDETTYEIPWSADQWYGHLKHTEVAVINDIIVGFVATEQKKGQQVVYRLATRPGYERLGVGTALMSKVFDYAGDSEIRVTVRESQQPSWYFLRSHGFKATPLGPYFAAPWQRDKENGYRFLRTKTEACPAHPSPTTLVAT